MHEFQVACIHRSIISEDSMNDIEILESDSYSLDVVISIVIIITNT